MKGVVTKSLENTIYLSCRGDVPWRVLTIVTRARPVPGSGAAAITLLKGLQAGDTRGQSVLHGYGNTGMINIGSTCGKCSLTVTKNQRRVAILADLFFQIHFFIP